MDLELGPILRALGRRRSAASLLVLEVAFAFLVISILVTTSRWYLATARISVGSHQHDLISIVVHTPMAPDAVQTVQARRADLRTLLAGVPGVGGVEPVSFGCRRRLFELPVQFVGRRPGQTPATTAVGWIMNTGAGLPELLGLAVREGVGFSAVPEADRAGSLILTRCLASTLGGGGSVIGMDVTAPGARGRVIGVVDDLVMGLPILRQSGCVALTLAEPLDPRDDHFVVRALPGQRDAVLTSFERQAPGALSTAIPGATLVAEPYEDGFSRYSHTVRGLVIVLMLMALEIAGLALTGAMAVSSFLVAERRLQIALRRALGATRVNVLRYFLIENFIATALGNTLGFHLLMLLFPNMQRAFQGIELAPPLLLATAVLLTINGLVATYVPAMRAARVSPAAVSQRA